MLNFSNEEIQKAYKEIRKRAVIDKGFRELLIKNPNLAIKQVTGKELPSEFKIKIIESDPNYNMTFVLPEMVTEKISDEELEGIAAGACKIQACADFDPCAVEAGA